MEPGTEDLTLFFRREVPPAEAQGDRAWYLVMVEGGEPGRRIRLAEQALVIGRSGPVDLLLKDPEISRRHCTVGVDPQLGAVVSDLGSTNGSFIDGRPVRGTEVLEANSFLQIGGHVFRCERLTAAEANLVAVHEEDMKRARDYVHALLPSPIASGPVQVDWAFVPSAQLGGDAFGYHWIDDRYFAMHLIDVSGHGAGAALHGASITALLRNQALLSQERRPERIVATLNDSFSMDDHAQMCFTVWCGVYDRATRQLAYCSAGHPPALRQSAGRPLFEHLHTPNMVAGVLEGYAYRSAAVEIAPGDALYVFSDGAFEVRDENGCEGLLDTFVDVLARTGGEPEVVLERMRARAMTPVLDDDFTMLRFRFD